MVFVINNIIHIVIPAITKQEESVSCSENVQFYCLRSC